MVGLFQYVFGINTLNYDRRFLVRKLIASRIFNRSLLYIPKAWTVYKSQINQLPPAFSIISPRDGVSSLFITGTFK